MGISQFGVIGVLLGPLSVGMFITMKDVSNILALFQFYFILIIFRFSISGSITLSGIIIILMDFNLNYLLDLSQKDLPFIFARASRR